MVGVDRFISEIRTEKYGAQFLNQFSLPSIGVNSISAVVPTYNRSPFNPNSLDGYKNPLKWCVESLLAQRNVSLEQIIIVDDHSSDYTPQTANYLKRKCELAGVELVYVRHDQNKGSPKTKNDGVKNATGDLIFFADDDCIFAPYALFGATYTLNQLRGRGINASAVHIPIYVRTTKPVRTVGISEIGQIDIKTGKATSNLKEFPEEYVTSPEYLDSRLKILEPLKIQNLGGIFISPREYLIEAGGYPEYFSWKNGFTEEAELSLRLAEVGVSLFHQPDPKFHTIHFKFGAGGNLEYTHRDIFSNPEDINISSISLEEMVNESSKPRRNTGNRVDPPEWYHAKIMSYAVLLGRRNGQAAINWARHTYRQFVEENHPDFSRSIGVSIESEMERRNIWKKAIIEARKLCDKLKEPSMEINVMPLRFMGDSDGENLQC